MGQRYSTGPGSSAAEAALQQHPANKYHMFMSMTADDTSPDDQLRDLHRRADELEHNMQSALHDAVHDAVQTVTVRSVLFESGDVDPTGPPSFKAAGPLAGRRFLMGEDPRLAPMPERPTLIDFFRLRIGPAEHLLQSARLARKAGLDDRLVLACLLHDISVAGFIRVDHGYWGAQLVAPYVDEEVAWAIRYHQALRFYADEESGYAYPDTYLRWFGEDYRPDPYIDRDYRYARSHRWYGSALAIVLNDYYAFDPTVSIDVTEFEDIIGRHFRQPEEGLGWDDSPSSHMWRTMITPTKFL
jgi:hypothetical protein